DFNQPVTITPNFQLSANGQAQLYFPKQVIALAPGQVKIANFAGDAGILQGTFVFNPPYQVKNYYPSIQVQTPSLGLAHTSSSPTPSMGPASSCSPMRTTGT